LKKVSFAESLEESIFCRIFGRKDLLLIRISNIFACMEISFVVEIALSYKWNLKKFS
jgi:hypothetical protein